MVLPRCSPNLVPGSTTVSSRCRLMCPGFTYGKVRWRPGLSRWRDGLATVMPRCLPVLKMIAAGVNRDATGINRDATVANWGEPWPNCLSRRFLPDCAPVHPCEDRFVPEQPGVIPVTHGLHQIIPVYHGRVPVLSRFVTVSPRFYSNFYISPASPRFAPVVLNV